MAWQSRVNVNTGVTADSGWCLWLAEEAVGAPHWYANAKEAANNADIHADRNFPTDAVVALFWNWTTNGVNYGHVVINVPGRGLFSSPKSWNQHGNAWYGSIDEVTNWLGGSSYIGWSPTLAGLQLAEWVAPTPVVPVPTKAEKAAARRAAKEAARKAAAEKKARIAERRAKRKADKKKPVTNFPIKAIKNIPNIPENK